MHSVPVSAKTRHVLRSHGSAGIEAVAPRIAASAGPLAKTTWAALEIREHEDCLWKVGVQAHWLHLHCTTAAGAWCKIKEG